jgi:hypothetical protein
VASIAGKPVYCISEVALIPLSSQADAEKAILKARDSQVRHAQFSEDYLTDASDDEDTISLADDESTGDPDPDPAPHDKTAEETLTKSSTIAQHVAARKLLFGRFADRWLSIRGAASRIGTAGSQDTREEDSHPQPTVTTAHKDSSSPVQPDHVSETKHDEHLAIDEDTVGDSQTKQDESDPASEKVPIALLPKLLSTSRFLFGSRNFFFSYDHDLSRRISKDYSERDVLELYKSFNPTVSSR